MMTYKEYYDRKINIAAKYGDQMKSLMMNNNDFYNSPEGVVTFVQNISKMNQFEKEYQDELQALEMAKCMP